MSNAPQAPPPAGGTHGVPPSASLSALVLRLDAAAAKAAQSGVDHEAALAELHASERALQQHLAGTTVEAVDDPPVAHLRAVADSDPARPKTPPAPPAADPVQETVPERRAARQPRRHRLASRFRGSARFATRGGTSFITTLCALAGTVSASVALVAAQEGDLRSDQGIIASVVTVVLVVIALVQRSPQVRLTIVRGVLEVATAKKMLEFALSDPEVTVRMTSQPGRRDWSVVFRNAEDDRFIVTPKIVDPLRFTKVIRRWRPEL